MRNKFFVLILACAFSSGAIAGTPADDKTIETTFMAAVAALQVQPARTPEDAVLNVLKSMRASVRFRTESPAPRGPHEWSGRRAFANHSVNGCVESAKVFFDLFHAAYPSYKALYLDSFDVVDSGGHAVVEVTGSDGLVFIVDATSFMRLPGPPDVDEESLSLPLDFRKDVIGRVVQFKGRSDVFVEKKDGRYRLAIYPYAHVFDGKPQSERSFGTLDELNRSLAEFDVPKKVDFKFLRENGLILPYVDADRTGFLYSGGSGISLHVIYSRYAQLPAHDEAEKVEPAARKSYEETGKAGTCNWSKVK